VVSNRLSAAKRCNIITKAAVRIAEKHGLESVNHQAVADACIIETSVATVRYHFATKDDLQRAAWSESTSPKVKAIGKEMGL